MNKKEFISELVKLSAVLAQAFIKIKSINDDYLETLDINEFYAEINKNLTKEEIEILKEANLI